ncbi:UNVERIFIED_CONTAM: QWRF motif-containing protein 2 [Sesamum latifolium]|uniref:QWRF motif-containing protein 2 n=1 Tax=Sesamum latifolium TaxID=2727402 RepID=A0AAW2WBX5_9LAMI
MVTAVTSTPKQRPSQNPKRPPLLSSDSDNAPSRRPKAREVSSRYLSLSTSSSSSNSSASTNTTLSSVTSGSSVASRRSQSPMPSRSVAVATPKSQQRAVSAERRRQGATTPSNAERMLVTSMRSLSVSFQGESYSLPVNKVKPPPAAAGTPGGLRKGTPERKKAGVTPVRDRRERDRENSRPSDHQQHRWPGRLRGENSSFFTRSLDYGTGRVKLSGSGSALKELRKSVVMKIVEKRLVMI